MSKGKAWQPVTLPAPMRAQPVADAVHGWLKYMPFERVVELWWMAQNERADEEDKAARRLANPDDMFGKSAEYANAYYARKAAEEPVNAI